MKSMTAAERHWSWTYLHIEFVGPGRVFVVGAVDLEGNAPESKVALQLRSIEARLQEHPMVIRTVLTLATPLDCAMVERTDSA